MKPEHMNYFGFTHIWFPKFLYGIWRKLCCKHGIHLWDECLSSAGGKKENNGWDHYLYCSACQIIIVIDHVDITYAKVPID